MTWETISKESQSKLLLSLPDRWRLDQREYQSLKDVTTVPYTCGILSEAQLRVTELTAGELVEHIEARKVTAVEVLEAFAARTAVAHQLVNCLTDWYFEEALVRAKELDDAFERSGELQGPLHGVPVALKDTFSVKGHATTSGVVSQRSRVPDEDSAIVRALREAGAVFHCRTTMPQTGMALETVSNLWGRTMNPFNRDLSAGGSSGGDAALVAMKGSPVTPSTDMGGSIRVPAAFNGLYGIRPTADRVPKTGLMSTNTGQISIKLSCGPICRSLADLELMTRIINAHPYNRYDVTSVPVPWREVDGLDRKLVIGVMKWDGVVMPHPPIIRALDYAVQKLKNDGHEVILFDPPFDCWDVSKTTFETYFPNGTQNTMATLAASGEPLIPVVQDIFNIYSPRHLTTSETLQLNIKIRSIKNEFAAAWEETKGRTTSARVMDALLCPASPALAVPHNFNVYWGYTSLFNILDYPSIILPIQDFKMNSQQSQVESTYQPQVTNPFDKSNHDLYDPNLYENQTMTLQLVGRPFDDEELIYTASRLDTIFKIS